MDPGRINLSTKTPVIPRPIDVVVVPKTFAVSSLVWLERCPLSVLGEPQREEPRADAMLLPSPLALLGTAIHHARAEVLAGRWGGAHTSLDAFRTVFSNAVESLEEKLRSESPAATLVPLRQTVGRREWMKRVDSAECWASTVAVKSQRAEWHFGVRRVVRADPAATPTEQSVRYGAEEMLHDTTLRLSGRPDWMEECGPNRALVSEFKSGRVVDGEGRLLEEHVLQVQAYALMLERAQPGIRVDPFVEGSDRTAVPWDDTHRNRLLDRLRKLDEKLPAGRHIAAEDLANPGAHCRFCRLRPMCSRYLRDVPSWWYDLPGSVRPLPLDVWGVVDKARSCARGTSIKLFDASGRRVLVDGLSRTLGMDEIEIGDYVWFFDLESSEDLDHHGAKVQPRNFHQVPPGPRWSTARRLRVFHRIRSAGGSK